MVVGKSKTYTIYNYIKYISIQWRMKYSDVFYDLAMYRMTKSRRYSATKAKQRTSTTEKQIEERYLKWKLLN